MRFDPKGTWCEENGRKRGNVKSKDLTLRVILGVKRAEE